VDLAFDWYFDYKDREPFTSPSELWKDDFIKENLIEETKITVYEIVNKK
jgi:hypothetical protein